MISVVLYGRNDSYGYNLHKRAALSFNCIAEVLESSDEIIFVDYNTPDDFPTFPEAIFDTLTDKARALLRILRVRSAIHDRFRSKTRLLALEPIARNIAVRRSNPSNRWILSTNTDLIFVPLHDRTLTGIIRDLGAGFYHAPRIELPETLWESLDRQNPRKVIDMVQVWGNTLHINEIVYGSEFILYDGPGDFQLIQRADLFKIQGFHEEMLLGWHVDSNVARRLGLLHGKVGDLGNEVFGYHCDHTRQVTGPHSHTRTVNDWALFVDRVKQPEIPEQADTWGCPNDDIEEIRLVPPRAQIYIRALENAIGKPLTEPTYAKNVAEVFDKVDYDPRHILPFLADLFATSPITTNVVWYGLKHETLKLFGSVWRNLGFKDNIIIDSDHPFLEPDELKSITVRSLPSPEAFASASIFVFDFGTPLAEAADEEDTSAYNDRIKELLKVFMLIVRHERERMRNEQSSRRVIAINVINNKIERYVSQFLAFSHSPFSLRIRHGFVLPPSPSKQDWLPALLPGPAGIRLGQELLGTEVGILGSGPWRHLDPGHYQLTIGLNAPAEQCRRRESETCVFLEILNDNRYLGVHTFKGNELDNKVRTVTFDVPDDMAAAINVIETRLRVTAEIEVTVRALTVERVCAAEPVLAQPVSFLQFDDWLPFLHVGPAGDRDRTCVQIKEGREGFVVYGPNWPLPRGSYFLTLTIEGNLPLEVGLVDVVAGHREIARAGLWSQSGVFGLPFEISEDLDDKPVQTRLVSSGTSACRLTAVIVHPIPYPTNWLPYLMIGPAGQFQVDPAGRTDHTSIRVHGEPEHFAAYGPYWKLPVGRYELSLVIAPYSFILPRTLLGRIDVFAEPNIIAERELRVGWHAAVRRLPMTVRLPFRIDTRDALVQIRVKTAGGPAFSIRHVSVVAQPLDEFISPSR